MEGFDRFSSFILKDATIDDAIGFAKELGVEDKNIVSFDKLKIDDVREIKNRCEVLHDKKIAFVFGDIGFDAQNALLKLTEEPPENTFFIFYKPENLLDTIYSRCQVVSIKREKDFVDDELKSVIEGDDEGLLKYLLSCESFSKEEMLVLLKKLLFYFSEKKDAKGVGRIVEFLKTYREFNLNKRLLLINIYLTLRGGHENSYC
ncbi:DNA polymerase III subunit delta' [Hippea alviniae]|uniref:DNA polymerase III subunit delta' n=1 Tax=Hippea alviniae TaxID=1279027 RepID=UPI0004164FC7|nr:DNA polymerase III subunit delta' [Hippea alviniae]